MSKVKIQLSVAIPSPAVLYYFLGVGGTFNCGEKCDPFVEIDLAKSGASSMAFPVPSWGKTHAYADSDAKVVAGKPDWFRTLRSGAKPKETGQLERTPSNLNAEFAVMPGASHGVKFSVVGANPLLSLAPAIDVDVHVGLRKNNGAVEFRATGQHDGFPDYRLIISERQVWFWDCVANGETPGALKYPAEHSFDTGWKRM